MKEATEFIPYSEQDEIDNLNYFSEFREKIFPAYQRNGFTFSDAFISHKLQIIQNLLDDKLTEGEK